ncbi:MAG: hypothetical protein BWX52_01871 [Bacteroidetes bacterium ADurb.Bin013]|nr:MAG: hypothetical protein BWX52_01871 [Bacteroidetes bacterium ADurb.Bin013]
MLFFLVKVNLVYGSCRKPQHRDGACGCQAGDIWVNGIICTGPTEKVIAFKELNDKIQGDNDNKGKNTDLEFAGVLFDFHMI